MLYIIDFGLTITQKELTGCHMR